MASTVEFRASLGLSLSLNTSYPYVVCKKLHSYVPKFSWLSNGGRGFLIVVIKECNVIMSGTK